MVDRTKRGKEKGIIKKGGEKRWGRKEREKNILSRKKQVFLKN